jgi:cyclopropane fatty-acyl-phospholipid synthase-like methyltransferase
VIGALEALNEELHFLKLNLARYAGIRYAMKVLDVGCGQGTFTVCVAELVAGTGRVTAVDISDEDVDKMNENLERHNVRTKVTFVKVDAAKLPSVFPQESFDMAVSYRLIEELRHPEQLPRIVSSIAEVVRPSGKVVMFELSTETRNIAEENLVRLHRDIGKDYFPSQREILRCLRDANLNEVNVETVPTDISYSGEVFLKSSISQDELWPEFKERIMKELWPSIEQYGMKYPDIRMFYGHKP